MKRNDWNKTYDLLQKGYNWILEEINNSGIRGRGGAGFYTGKKIGFLPKNSESYLIINADEGEPGTCKDRSIITYEPHKIIEGALIVASLINAKYTYIYIRGEFYKESVILQKAIDEAINAEFLGPNACGVGKEHNIYIHRGAGAYICGEETALIESLTGRTGKPRNKPPFPASVGYLGMPTLVSNVETIASIPTILRRGAKWFASIGTAESKGTKVFCISGNVDNPCVVEEAMGIKMRDLIERYAGGVSGGWDNLVAVWPGGSSCRIMTKAMCDDAEMSFEGLVKAGSSFGTGGLIVLNNSFSVVEAVERLSYFYMHESCGQCTPCREGTGWMWRIMSRIVEK
uniref:NADH-ubiquinone oxidoreductase 51kDa subunit iron-sulphur binding domain-containing protein n=1 Tax=Biomphalaria glabrata TaxID=6526 RepID=A0A2C9LSW5_BIOGL